MKKKLAAAAIVSILVIASAIWIIANYAANQADKACEIRITQFTWTSNWGTGPVGLLWGRSFNVTLHNAGTMGAEGLAVEVKLLANNTQIWSETWFNVQGTGGQTEARLNFTFELNPGEVRELQGSFVTKLDELSEAQGERSFLVEVSLDDTVVDELQLDMASTHNVQITEFTVDQSLGGSFIDCKFNVTVQNFGPDSISDVLLEVTAFDSEGTEAKQYTEQLGTLSIREERKITGLISIYVFLTPQHFQIQSALIWNGTVLDEQTLP